MCSHKWTAALALVVLFALPLTTANAQSIIGNANSVKTQAEGSIAGTLSAGNDVHASETIRTGSSGQVGLRFIDSTNLSVGPSSSVRLDKFVYDPKKGSGRVAIDITKGAFRFVTGAQNKGDYKVKTPTGTIGMRG